MSQERALRIGAAVVGALASVWYFHDVARVTAGRGPMAFPWLPAALASGGILLALYLSTRQKS